MKTLEQKITDLETEVAKNNEMSVTILNRLADIQDFQLDLKSWLVEELSSILDIIQKVNTNSMDHAALLHSIEHTLNNNPSCKMYPNEKIKIEGPYTEAEIREYLENNSNSWNISNDKRSIIKYLTDRRAGIERIALQILESMNVDIPVANITFGKAAIKASIELAIYFEEKLQDFVK